MAFNARTAPARYEYGIRASLPWGTLHSLAIELVPSTRHLPNTIALHNITMASTPREALCAVLHLHRRCAELCKLQMLGGVCFSGCYEYRYFVYRCCFAPRDATKGIFWLTSADTWNVCNVLTPESSSPAQALGAFRPGTVMNPSPRP